MSRVSIKFLWLSLSIAAAAQANVSLFLEEPYGTFGGMNPTGHAAIYLSDVCAASPVSLRPCHAGEHGVVISRYHRISHYDWIAIPLIPYLYAVDRPDQVPFSATAEDVAALRNSWRRANLAEIVPDAEDGSAPPGDWIQLVGAAYVRTIYAFEIETTANQDGKLTQALNSGPNKRRFNLIFHNCADFARHAIDFYYPRAVHRSLIGDVGIMTPKQAARSLVSYSRRHRDVELRVFVIPQVPGDIPRSTRVRGVLESLVRSKRYALPLVSLAALHPYLGCSLAFAWVDGNRFNPRRMAESADSDPTTIAHELESDQIVTARNGD